MWYNKHILDYRKIIQQIPFLIDAIGNQFSLALIEEKDKSSSDFIVETPYTFWTIISDNESEYAFWRKEDSQRDLINKVINGIEVIERTAGIHYLFATQNISYENLPGESDADYAKRKLILLDQASPKTYFEIKRYATNP